MTIPYDSSKLQKNYFGRAELRWPACLGQGEHSRRITERNLRDGRDEVGTQSVHVAPFSLSCASRRHGLWRWRIQRSELAYRVVLQATLVVDGIVVSEALPCSLSFFV